MLLQIGSTLRRTSSARLKGAVHRIRKAAAKTAARASRGPFYPARNLRNTERFAYRNVELELPRDILTPRILDAFEKNYYEGAEADEILHILQDGERVLEIGSAIGFLSTVVAKTGKPSRVIAVEANPELVEISKRTFALNNVNVDVHNEILGPEDGEGELFVHGDFWASSTRPWEGARRVTVPKRNFQKRLQEWKPTLILVDIEGGEETLFDGVDLSGVERIMLEVHQEVIGRTGMKRVFDILSAQNFHYDQWHSSKRIVTFTSIFRL